MRAAIEGGGDARAVLWRSGQWVEGGERRV